jgi:hypothetical protein
MEVAVLLPVAAVVAGAVIVAGAAVAATAVVAQSAGKAAQATFSNENLRKAANDLFPDVQVEGVSLTIRTPEGVSLRFRPQGNYFRPEPVGLQDMEKFRLTTGRVVQRFALLQILDAARKQGLTVVEQADTSGDVIRLRLRAEAEPGQKAAEMSAELKTDGNVDLEAHGIKGPACSRLLEPVVQALGSVRVREKTPEYYESVRNAAPDQGRERN